MFYKNVHLFRGFAILGIVATHSIETVSWEKAPFAHLWIQTFFSESSIWFAFIAGFLFHHLRKKYSTQSYYLSKLKNVISPYVVTSIPALILIIFFMPTHLPAPFASFSAPTQATALLLTGTHMAQLWFIPTISIIYLAAPILLKADTNRSLYMLMPVMLIYSFFFGREGIQSFTGLGIYIGPLSKACYLIGPYVFGMFCSRYYSETMNITRKYLYLWLTVVSAGFIADGLSPEAASLNWILAWKVFTAPLLLLLLEKVKGAAETVFSEFGKYSFGIFFLHGYFLNVIKALIEQSGVAYTQTTPFIVWSITLVITMLTSILALMFAEKCFGFHSRRLVGV